MNQEIATMAVVSAAMFAAIVTGIEIDKRIGYIKHATAVVGLGSLAAAALVVAAFILLDNYG